MRVVISNEAFGKNDCKNLPLLSIIAFGLQGRHDIITDPIINQEDEPVKGTNLSKWVQEQSNELAEEIMFALSLGVEEGIGGGEGKG